METVDKAIAADKDRILTVEEMLAADDVEYKEIDGWGGKIRIGSLSAEDLMDWSEANEGEAKKTAGVRLVIRSLVDKDGKRIGRDKDIAAFKKKSQSVLERIVKEVLKLNGLEAKAQEKAKND